MGSAFDVLNFNSQFPPSFFEDLIEDSASSWYNTIDATSFSEDARQLIKDLIDNLLDTANIPDDFAYSDLKAIVTNWETDIANSTIENSEKDLLYHVASIARFSLLYWYNYYMLDPSFAKTTRILKRRKWWQWLIVGVCDIAGVAAGATVNPGVAVSAGSAASGAAATIINWGSN